MPARLISKDIVSLHEKGKVVLFDDGHGPKRPTEAIEKGISEMLHAVKEGAQRDSELGGKMASAVAAIKGMAESLELAYKAAKKESSEEEFLEIEVSLRVIQSQLDQIIALQKAQARKRKYKFVHTRQHNQIVTEVIEVKP